MTLLSVQLAWGVTPCFKGRGVKRKRLDVLVLLGGVVACQSFILTLL